MIIQNAASYSISRYKTPIIEQPLLKIKLAWHDNQTLENWANLTTGHIVNDKKGSSFHKSYRT